MILLGLFYLVRQRLGHWWGIRETLESQFEKVVGWGKRESSSGGSDEAKSSLFQQETRTRAKKKEKNKTLFALQQTFRCN